MKSRNGTRHLCAELIKVVWTDETGAKRKEIAALEDIARGGACIQFEHPMTVDTPISLIYPYGRYYGKVKYCQFQYTGYFVGVQFDPGYEWSKEQFTPSHLTDVAELPVSRRKPA
jgi:hypothetical protein